MNLEIPRSWMGLFIFDENLSQNNCNIILNAQQENCTCSQNMLKNFLDEKAKIKLTQQGYE